MSTNVLIVENIYQNPESFYYSPKNESEKATLTNTTSKLILAKLFAQSWWNVFDERYLRHSFSLTIAITIIFLVIFVIGIIGNCSVVFILVGHPQMRSVTNMFITNLAIADLLVVVFYVPVKLCANVFKPWILGMFTCKYVHYIQMVSVCGSAYSLVAISLVRCQAVYRSFGQIRLSNSQTIKTILLIWITSGFILSPWIFAFDILISETDGLPKCIEKWENENYGKIYFIISNLLFCYCIPLSIISTSSGIICYRVTYRVVPQHSASTDVIKQMHKKAKTHIRRMLATITLAFLVSWLPVHVILTRMKFASDISKKENNIYKILLPFAEMLGSGNSCLNPILYAFLNKEFRESIQSLLPPPLRPHCRRESLASMCMVSYGLTASNIIFPNSLQYQMETRILYSAAIAKRHSIAYPKSSYTYQYQRHRHSYPVLPMSFLQAENQRTLRTSSPSKSTSKEFGFKDDLMYKNGAGSKAQNKRSNHKTEL